MSGAITKMSQSIDLSMYKDAIASGNVSLHLSAWLGGWLDQDDSSDVSVSFLDLDKQRIGNQVNIGPVKARDRASITSLLFRENFSMVPINTRYLAVVVTFIFYGGTDNDGYADNISIELNYG